MSDKPIYDFDDAILTLENEREFYEAWHTLAQKMLPLLLKPIEDGAGNAEIRFYWHANAMSFSAFEIVKGKMADLVRRFVRQIIKPVAQLSHTDESEVSAFFMEKAIAHIKQGEISLDGDTLHALSVIHSPDTKSVAAACRELNITRGAVTRLKKRYPQTVYERYHQLKSGTPYNIVMGDCAPFIQNQPPFQPITLIKDGAEGGVEKGDLVAEWGSDRWHEVDALGVSGGLVFTTTGIVNTPCRRLPKRYRKAKRFERLCA